jgi:hypothetical protein
MKSLLFFIAGMLTTIFVVFLISAGSQLNERHGLTIFPEPKGIISTNQLRVFQVVEPNMALAETNESYYEQIVVLVTNDEGKYYYDNEIIKIPSQKKARQTGVYKYKTTSGDYKTVPVVRIE